MGGVPVRLLVVDDEDGLLRLVMNYLTRLGYSASGCGTAASAMAQFCSDPEAISLAVVDVTLPDGRGDELAMQFLHLSAQVRILLYSGYPVSLDMFPAEFRRRVGTVQKPFTPSALAQEIKRLLAS
jgi:two-component system, cell cycle sensor histidine kinase and response regulator CckA